jgi:cytidyltransferase-like protein
MRRYGPRRRLKKQPKIGSNTWEERGITDLKSKIKDLDALAHIVGIAKAQDKKVALCHGVFDLLHPGHIRHFEAARKFADVLVVTVVADENVRRGPGRPVFNQRLRVESVAALANVDYVAISDSRSAADVIRRISPSIFAMGSKHFAGDPDEDMRIEELKAIEEVGAESRVTEEITFSSTNLLNNFFSVFSPEADRYLREFRMKYSADDVIARLKSLRSLKVLVLGDVIIDEYTYCKAIGKSSKSPTLSTQYLYTERYAGGVLAVANHIAGFVDRVNLVSIGGSSDEDNQFIKNNLKPNINAHFFLDEGSQVVVKRRYVDPFQISKMFEISWVNGEAPNPEIEKQILTRLQDLISSHDLVIIADFGHGGIGNETIQWIAKQSIFLAVNTQTNSANAGYNLIYKYPRADYICIDENEIRLANHNRHDDIGSLIIQTAKQLNSSLATVTRGSDGSLTWAPESDVIATPVFSTEVIDSVGAGDAYLSVTSLCAKANLKPDLIGFIGNCVGALAVRIVGNKQPVEVGTLYSFITSLLK